MSDAPTDDRLSRRVSELTSAVSTIARNQEEGNLRGRISAHGGRLAQNLANSEAAIAQAKNALAAAHDEGEGSAISDAQLRLTEAVSARDGAKRDLEEHRSAVRQFDAEVESRKTAPVPADTPPEKDYSNLNSWKADNKSWYGVDAEMTQAVHAIDKEIRAAGVIEVGSKEYFNAVDSRIASKYPDRLKTTPETASTSKGDTVTGDLKTGRIPADVVNTWARMGIPVNEDGVMEKLVKGREALVHKDILPEKPAYGRIKT